MILDPAAGIHPASAVRAAVATASLALVHLCAPPPSLAEVGFVGNSGFGTDPPRLRACNPSSNCVSSNYLEPPNRYVSALKTLNARDAAFQRAVRDLSAVDNDRKSIVEVVPKDYYVHVTVPGTAPGSFDDLEVLFGAEGGIVNVRCEARVTLPPPPFCVKKNCINGNMDQRTRVGRVARILGLPPADQKQMQQTAKWTPIFLNSDRVPDMLEYDDF